MTTGPGVALAALRDVTTIGIAVHAHAAAFHGARLTAPTDPSVGAHGAEALLLRGRAWQRLHRELSRFVTLAPPSATVRDDLIALVRLLHDLAPLDTHTVAATLADPATRRIGAGLNGAVATMTSIGDQSADAFLRLSHAGRLHVYARDLPRSLVSEHPELAERWLEGGIVHAPEAVVDAVRAAFTPVQLNPVQVPASSPLVGPFSVWQRHGSEPFGIAFTPPCN